MRTFQDDWPDTLGDWPILDFSNIIMHTHKKQFNIIAVHKWQRCIFMHDQIIVQPIFASCLILLKNLLMVERLWHWSKKGKLNTYGLINSTRGSVLRLKCKSRQLVSPSTAEQGFSPRLSGDGSLIYSKGGPLHKQPAPLKAPQASSCLITIFNLTTCITYLKTKFCESTVGEKT